MKIYPRIIPEGAEISQKKSDVQPKSRFEALFKEILASKVIERPSEEPSLPTVPQDLIEKAEKILDTLEDLLSQAPDSQLGSLADLSREILTRLQEVPEGPARKVLEEVALLGVVEAEKRLV